MSHYQRSPPWTSHRSIARGSNGSHLLACDHSTPLAETTFDAPEVAETHVLCSAFAILKLN